MTDFTQFGLDARLLQSLETEGYTTPTPIQAKAIPAVMTGADLLGIAQTGTGKTAAFALPILHRLAADRKPAPRRGCRVLVLSPTRELASQIADSFRTYGRHLGITVAVVFGGVGHRPQVTAMSRGVDVLVATPGRLLDHTGERNISLTGTEIFVLDEADQMLDLGFLQPIRKVVAQLTTKRQNLFFSATMPSEIGKLAGELLHDPVKVSVAPAATTAERVSQRVIHVERHKKRAVLVELLSNSDLKRALVFTRTKRGADKVAEHLEGADISVAAIHGNKSQGQRERALDQFRNSKIRVLVATDIAARGIDIDQVSHVINFELPEVPEAYVHRIGRTARAGAEGIAISLCDPDERGQLRDIERMTRQSIPHENRITGEEVPLDATGAPRGRPEGRARQGRPNGGRGDGERRHGGGDSRPRDGARGERGGYRPEAVRTQDGERNAAARRDGGDSRPRDGARGERQHIGDRGNRGGHRPDGARAEGGERRDFGARREGGDSRPRERASGERQHNGDRGNRGGHRPDGARAEGGERRDFGARREGGDSRPRERAHGERQHNGDRNERGGHRPDGARAEGGERKQFGARREGGDSRPRGGKPGSGGGGYQGLKRKTPDKGIWTNR